MFFCYEHWKGINNKETVTILFLGGYCLLVHKQKTFKIQINTNKMYEMYEMMMLRLTKSRIFSVTTYEK